MKARNNHSRRHAHRGEQLLEMLCANIIRLLAEILPKGQWQGSEWRCGNVEGDVGGSLSVCIQGEKAGLWYDHATGQSGNLLNLVKETQGLSSHREAMYWARAWLTKIPFRTLDEADAVAGRHLSALNDSTRMEKARSIWVASVPITGTLAEQYLRSRRIECALSSSLRFNAGLYHSESALSWPALVCAVQCVGNDEIVAVQAVFLDPVTGRKIQQNPSKKSFGFLKGGAVRLREGDDTLVLCEGVETGLSIAQACKSKSVWATLGTSGLRMVEVPGSVSEVIIAADADDAGREAAMALARRLAPSGTAVRISFPPGDFNDFNDALMSMAECDK